MTPKIKMAMMAAILDGRGRQVQNTIISRKVSSLRSIVYKSPYSAPMISKMTAFFILQVRCTTFLALTCVDLQAV